MEHAPKGTPGIEKPTRKPTQTLTFFRTALSAVINAVFYVKVGLLFISVDLLIGTSGTMFGGIGSSPTDIIKATETSNRKPPEAERALADAAKQPRGSQCGLPNTSVRRGTIRASGGGMQGRSMVGRGWAKK